MYKHKESTWKIDSNNNYEEVNEFIEKKIKKIKTTREDLTSIESLFNNYITITKNYCEQIALLALQIKPLANTIEGDLAQAIQGIFLFNTDSLETLAKNIEIFFLNRTKKDTGVNVIEEFSKLYQINLSEALGKYCLYIEEIEKYEKFLMNKEILKNENEKNNINQVLEKIQAIDISYKEILPLSSLSNGKKDLVIYTSDKEITLWKYDGTKYSLTIKTKVEKCYFLLSEIKEEISLCVRENNDYLIDFYSFDKTFEKKKSLKIYADPSQLIMLSNDIMAIRIEGKIGLLLLADINKCQIVQTILFESSYYFLYVNKFNKILANILHNNQYSYTTFLREFSYENGCLYRRKTIGDIEPMSYAESENGLLIVGEKGRISIFK